MGSTYGSSEKATMAEIITDLQDKQIGFQNILGFVHDGTNYVVLYKL